MFKVGQKVWDVLRGEGEVSGVYRHSMTPVVVRFKNWGPIGYTMEGTLGGNFKRSLFFSEPKIEAATEPVWEPTLKEGQEVLVRPIGSKYAHSIIVYHENKETVLSDKGWWYAKECNEFYKIGEKIIV